MAPCDEGVSDDPGVFASDQHAHHAAGGLLATKTRAIRPMRVTRRILVGTNKPSRFNSDIRPETTFGVVSMRAETSSVVTPRDPSLMASAQMANRRRARSVDEPELKASALSWFPPCRFSQMSCSITAPINQRIKDRERNARRGGGLSSARRSRQVPRATKGGS